MRTIICETEQTHRPEQKVWTAEEMFKDVHGGRNLQWGARRTWPALNKRFPDHTISFHQIDIMVAKCPSCQKERLGMDVRVEPVYCHLKKSNPRGAVGMYLSTVTICEFPRSGWIPRSAIRDQCEGEENSKLL